MHQEEINNAVESLRSGGVILYPTDTIWGLGADATNPGAVQRVLDIKERDDNMGLIVLVERDSRLNRYVDEVPEMAWDLIDLAEEPLTIIYPQGRELAAKVCAPDGSVAIRMVRDEFCERLISKLNRPLISTSANLSGQRPPISFEDIAPEVLEGVDYTVNLRQSEPLSNRPSSIIKLDLDGTIKIVR